MDLPSFRDWMARHPERRLASWLILGKGPSFARLDDLETAGYLRVGLNHVVRETRVDVFHAIDIEVIEHCAAAIEQNAGVAVLPWAPHVRRRLLPFSSYEEFLPSGLSLAAYVEQRPLLRRLARQGRLLWYNLHTAPRRLRRREAPITAARGFSASAVTALLADCGVRRIRTLGVDGGASYAGCFADLNDTTRLRVGQASYDSQFEAMAGHIRRYGLDLGPLDRPAARVRIEVGADEALPARVLAHALRQRASLHLDIHYAGAGVAGGAADVGPGRTLVLSAASLVPIDPRPYWTLPDDALQAVPEGAPTPALGVRSMSASGVGSWLLPPPALRPTACGDSLQGPVLHWAPGEPRPWERLGARGELAWCQALIAAFEDGDLDRALVGEAVAAGHARPSLLVQLDRRVVDPVLLRRKDRMGDPRPVSDDRCGLRRRFQARIMRLATAVGWSRWSRYGWLVLDKGRKVIRGLGRWSGER